MPEMIFRSAFVPTNNLKNFATEIFKGSKGNDTNDIAII